MLFRSENPLEDFWVDLNSWLKTSCSELLKIARDHLRLTSCMFWWKHDLTNNSEVFSSISLYLLSLQRKNSRRMERKNHISGNFLNQPSYLSKRQLHNTTQWLFSLFCIYHARLTHNAISDTWEVCHKNYLIMLHTLKRKSEKGFETDGLSCKARGRHFL